ncbi:DUF305 domain-containing protein [Kibdelosporangium philippinense]|uniref:DUF305 domain-containing protein n=1 Tax=Kibdelosporangium philippinense TaxID=211113 RepID=A0ABS8ZJA6_9PSEU|nr:DUF305 domain-containing protein [Kibdelosporangium philippinense]MCE7006716.1 DUF305 domain-containing protein [Kibdelosporangium philippinense]
MIVIRLILLLLVLTGCGGQVTGSVPETPASGTGRSTSSFGLTERAFVELAIATDEQAVKLLGAGAKLATHSALRQLANDIGAARRAEVVELHGLLAAAAVEYVNNHKGHDMPGMPTDEEISALTAAGPGFDALFAKLLRAHLDESITVARSAAQAVSDEPTRALARRMQTDRIGFTQRLGAVVPV